MAKRLIHIAVSMVSVGAMLLLLVSLGSQSAGQQQAATQAEQPVSAQPTPSRVPDTPVGKVQAWKMDPTWDGTPEDRWKTALAYAYEYEIPPAYAKSRPELANKPDAADAFKVLRDIWESYGAEDKLDYVAAAFRANDWDSVARAVGYESAQGNTDLAEEMVRQIERAQGKQTSETQQLMVFVTEARRAQLQITARTRMPREQTQHLPPLPKYNMEMPEREIADILNRLPQAGAKGIGAGLPPTAPRAGGGPAPGGPARGRPGGLAVPTRPMPMGAAAPSAAGGG